MEFDDKDKLRTALKDAGCPEDVIREVLLCSEKDRQERILQRHRASLLNDMHTSQRRIDILDYIVRYLQGKERFL